MNKDKKDLLIAMVSSAIEDIINQNTLDFDGVRFWTESATEDEVCQISELLARMKRDVFINSIHKVCKEDSDFRFLLIDMLKSNFTSEVESNINAETVTAFLHNPDLHRQDIIDILDNADVSNCLREEWYDDIVNDFFDSSDGSDIIEKCNYRQEDQLKEYFEDSYKDDFKERAKDAIDNM